MLVCWLILEKKPFQFGGKFEFIMTITTVFFFLAWDNSRVKLDRKLPKFNAENEDPRIEFYCSLSYNFWTASRSKIGTEFQGRTAQSYILKIPIQKRGKDQKWNSLCFLLWLAHPNYFNRLIYFLKKFANLTTLALNIFY